MLLKTLIIWATSFYQERIKVSIFTSYMTFYSNLSWLFLIYSTFNLSTTLSSNSNPPITKENSQQYSYLMFAFQDPEQLPVPFKQSFHLNQSISPRKHFRIHLWAWITDARSVFTYCRSPSSTMWKLQK